MGWYSIGVVPLHNITAIFFDYILPRLPKQMSSAITSDKIFWEQFFLDAGFQIDLASDFAILFNNHHLTKEMLPDISKDHLIDMGIKMIGDIILIQKQAKVVHEKEIKSSYANKYKTNNHKTALIIDRNDVKPSVKSPVNEPMDINIKQSSPILPHHSTLQQVSHSKSINHPKNINITRQDKVFAPEPARFSPIVMASTPLPTSKVSVVKNEILTNKLQSSKGPSTTPPLVKSNHQRVTFVRTSLDLKGQVPSIEVHRPVFKSVSHGIFANERHNANGFDQPVDIRNRLGVQVTPDKPGVGRANERMIKNLGSSPFSITVSNDVDKVRVNRDGVRYQRQMLPLRRRQVTLASPTSTPNINYARNAAPEKRRLRTSIIPRGLIRKKSYTTQIVDKKQNINSVLNRLGKKSAKERLGN